MKSLTPFLLLLVSPFFLYTTCKRVSPGVKDNYIIVGSGGGLASLASYYLVGDGQLKKDTIHRTLASVPEDNAQFRFDVVMPDSMYRKVATLGTSIPPELLQHNNATYGKSWPDAGYREVRTRINGIDYRWHFEIDQSKSSAAVQAFYARLTVLN